jgi:hypothetical protein
LGRTRIVAALEPLDVGFDLFGHLHQDRGGAAVEDRLSEAPALFGASAHPLNYLAIFFSHNDGNSPRLRPFLHLACRRRFPTGCVFAVTGKNVPDRDSPECRVARVGRA